VCEGARAAQARVWQATGRGTGRDYLGVREGLLLGRWGWGGGAVQLSRLMREAQAENEAQAEITLRFAPWERVAG
jgi:hypothetical protein